MTVLIFSLILLFFGYLSGLVGALTGLGGGVVLIPAMVLLLKIDIHYAMGASLLCVIATSSGAALAKSRNYANLRIGILLETAAVLAALLGALLVPFIPAATVALLFGCVLLFSAYLTLRRNHQSEPILATSHPWARALQLAGHYPSKEGLKSYQVQNVPLAWALMALAGLMSGLLGIGAGALKVLAMDQALRLPYKVSTTTSNFIMGITAAVSVGVYFSHGYIVPLLAFPVVLGVIVGSWSGGYVLEKIESKKLRVFFAFIIMLLAAQMLYKAFTGDL